MNYNLAFSRNIGLFTVEQQEKLKQAKVLIAGVGGVGGVQAATLARFGIGELIIFDPGKYDEPDVNRQYGAMVSMLGKFKAEVMANIIKDINPNIKITSLCTTPSGEELSSLMQGCSLVVDAIEHTEFEYKVEFARIARNNNLYNLNAPIPGFGVLMIIFDPEGETYEKFCRAPADRSKWKNHVVTYEDLIARIPGFYSIKNFAQGLQPYIPTCGGAAALNGGIVASEIAFIITGIRKKEDIVVAPRITYVNTLDRIYGYF